MTRSEQKTIDMLTHLAARQITVESPAELLGSQRGRCDESSNALWQTE